MATRVGRVLIVGFLAICVHSPANSADKVSLRYGFVATGINAFWIYGRALGIFSKVGIELELREGKGSAVTAQTVANGTDDFGTDIDGGTFIGLAAKGLPATAILADTAKSPLAILSPEKSPLKTPQDLIGKQVGVTLGGGSGAIFPLLLQRNDIRPNRVTSVNLQPGALLSTLLEGRLDGITTFATVGGALEQRGLMVHAMMFSDFKVATPPPFVIVGTALIDRNPDLVARFVDAARKSLLAAMQNPVEAIVAFAAAYPSYGSATAAAEQRIFFELGWPNAKSENEVGRIPIKDIETEVEVLSEAGFVPAGTDPSKYIRTRFLMK
jgi:NitT/TauT family transport system substrate-binding protein